MCYPGEIGHTYQGSCGPHRPFPWDSFLFFIFFFRLLSIATALVSALLALHHRKLE